MRGNDRIIELLNEVLTAELTAVNQYFLHAKMCHNWGYERLAEHVRAESIDEMRHADKVTDRVLFLEGVPNYQRYFPLAHRRDRARAVPVRSAARVHRHRTVEQRHRRGRELGDNGTRELLAEILVAEEEHADWLETQLETIRQIGIENYLAQQLHS